MNANIGEMDILRDLAARLETAKHGQKSGMVADAAKLLNCSKQEVYRKLKSLGWTSGRKPRADRGKGCVDEELAGKMAHLLSKAVRANGKKTMQMTTARDMMAESGEGVVNPETGEVTMPSVTTLSRAMRRHGCHPDMLAQGKPHTHMKSLHPNHVWQVDASLCVLFYLPKGRMAICDETQFYKNKPNYSEKARKQRVWRYIITDHYSGNFYLYYAQAAGENSADLIECFLHTICKRGLDDPMHGVPLIILMDKGSANTSALFLNLLDRLGVKYITHAVGSSRVKGQVEQCQNLVETQFESRLAFTTIKDLDQLQALADSWRKHYCAYKRHSRHGRPRNDVWLTITEEQLRLAPSLELCRELVTTKPVEVKVKPDLSITHPVKGYGRRVYDLRMLPGIVPQAKVRVVVNPYRVPAVDVLMQNPATFEDSVWTVEPVEMDEAGFWENAAIIGQETKTLADTVVDKHVKRIDEAAGAEAGKSNRKGLKAPEGVEVFADVDAKPAPDYIPKRGRDLGLDASTREIPPMTLTEAAMTLKERLGDLWTPEAYGWLAQRYKDGVPADEIDSIAARFERHDKPQILKVVGGSEA